MGPKVNGRTLHWFRKGLRLKDNKALLSGLQTNPESFFPVFILDKWHSNKKNVGSIRFRFILESLQDLDRNLKKQGCSCGLLIFEGEPEELLPTLWKELKISTLTFDDSEENEPHSRQVDEVVKDLAKKEGVEVICTACHYLHSPESYSKLLKGGPLYPHTYTNLLKLFQKLGNVPAPLSLAENYPFIPKILDNAKLPPRKDIANIAEAFPNRFTGQLGESKFPGGEQEALERLKTKVKDRKKWVKRFHKPSTSPVALEPATTVLSPYLTHGCISVREVWHAVQEIEQDRFPCQTSLCGQLLWRELWYIMGRNTPNYGKMKGNPICKQIPWDNDKALVKAWKTGQTGYPLIDAFMTQLRQEGWIHHLARHRVACFLTRGDLWQSWEQGAAAFDEMLIDADWSLNNSNWMWLSCSAFYSQYFKCFSPVSKELDKDGYYIRKYVKPLAKMPKRYLLEPWKAPLNVQVAANCIIGKDYPEPIVYDHKTTSRENMARMKQAFAEQKKLAPKKRKFTEGKFFTSSKAKK
mmetsp:Transcript_7057/g.8129  ORF Transcript_7057/g.8129 Transcript_7057/m.8129 type:complete len:524 (-) Transcript_7057:659-2230(-)